MEPGIQYAKTSDGVNVAYSELGEGTPFIVLSPIGVSHVERVWGMFPFLTALAKKFRVVLFDWRGHGLSDRRSFDFSMQTMIRDIEAVAARTGVESCVLGAWGQAVPIAVTYVSQEPARVSHLFLTDGFARWSDFAHTPAYKSLLPLVETEWEMYADVVSRVLWSHTNPDFATLFADYMRASCEPAANQAQWKAFEGYDVSALLPKVMTPTLVVHNKRSRLFALPLGQQMAADIPNARLALIDDVTFATFPDLAAEFVFGEQVPSHENPALLTGTAIILFADIVDSTALTERLGDAVFRDKARDLDSVLRQLIREHSGSTIEGKLLGDGVLAIFTAARDAINAALACGAAGESADLPLHLGLHAGDVIREENNVYGGAVNIASRISGLSAPGEVMVSDTVRSLARTSAGVSFEDRGEQALKGIAEPQRVFAVARDVGSESS